MRKFTFKKSGRRFLALRSTLLVSALILSSLSFAQTVTTTFANGTTTNGTMPIYGFYGYSYTQEIYLATDMDVLVQGQASYITKVRFYNTSGSLTNANSWTVYMGNTSLTNFATTTSWIPATSLTQVFTGTLTAPAANTWMEITLNTPFLWNGVDNLVVAIDENTPGFSTINWRTNSTGSNRSISYYNDTNNPNPSNPPTASNRYGYVAHAQFVHDTTTCAGTPTNVTPNISSTSICEGSTVSLSGLESKLGLTYQWQYDDGSGFQNYTGATSQSFTTPALTQSVTFRAQTTCSFSGLSDFSDNVTVTVNPNPVVSVDVVDAAFCSSTPVTITASGANTYAWFPAAGLDNTNTGIVNANPTAVTMYTVTGTSIFGCIGTTTSKITPLNQAVRTATYTPGVNCAPGTLVTIDANVTPAIINGGSTWEYRFFDATGTVFQNFGASDTYSFTPSSDSVYTVYYQVRANGCTDVIDSNKVEITIGFGADVAIVDYDCNNLGGIVSLSSIFGQPIVDTVYVNPLMDAVNDITNVTFSGIAAITGGRAVLTPSQTGASGSILINEPTFAAGFNNAMTVSFKMTADQPINTFGTGGADGICYSFGDDVANSGHQNGTGSKLRLSFDAAGNSPNQPGVYLVYGFTGTTTGTSITPTGLTTLAYSSNTAAWKIKQDAQVVLTIDSNGKASVTVDGVVIFSNIQMPVAYMNANTTGWKHVFGATTGGDAMRQAVSDFKVTAPQMKFALVDENVTPSTWQSGTSFSGIQPGMYDVWISSDTTTNCAKMVQTIEVINTNPLVELGNDTTICAGNSILLDAGNIGSSYVWSNSQVTTQTLQVSNAGSYVAYVTAPNGCVGVGTINVSIASAPTASSVFVQNNNPSYTFTVLNPTNVNQYTWDFGDGTIVSNGPASISHTYSASGTYNVVVVITNDCGFTSLTQSLTINSTVGLNTNSIEGLSVYPNPSSNKVTIVIPEAMEATAQVYSMTGALVATIEKLDVQTVLSVQDWTPGIYFVQIKNETQSNTIKLVVE